MIRKLFLKKNKNKLYLQKLVTDNLVEIESFFAKYLKEDPRLIFNYYNFIHKNYNNVDVFKVLNQYFEDKSLFIINPKDKALPLNLKNIDVKEELTVYNNHDKRKVSVIMTTYNIEDLVEIAVNSLLHQTYKNIEIILVDDGSTDDTTEILYKFKKLYPDKIQLITLNQNHGAYIAKNIGITYAKGDLLTFHDADDWSHPQRIEEHVRLHRKDQKVKFSISKLIRVTEDGYFYSKHIYPLDRLSMVSLMIERSLIDEIGYFRTHRLGSDTEYFERLKKFTKHSFERIDKVLMFCSHRANSLTTSPETGVEGFGRTNKRQHYWNQWHKWHDMLKKSKRKPYIKFDSNKYEHEIIE